MEETVSQRKIAGYGTAEWKMAGVVFVVASAVLVSWIAWRYESPEKVQARLQASRDADEKLNTQKLAAMGHPNAKVSDGTALYTCQSALRKAVSDPEAAVIPDVGWMKGGADWRFLWSQDSRMVRVRNALGLDVAVTALCVVDEESGHIKLLTVDGKQLIAPGKSL
ncbi:hypothetical protein [Acidovorax sp. BLS4]|uniref:hypothetical protein n=1 Tax=Acidovorax sp. BLS4 TaxID=3273430 RepID=UPI002943638A|nr:hypothetical protein [Paracidovorax avenae]WOI45866.1 hypothetical protein R1Z03_01225 [Paracidovorax avenae]